MPQIEGGRWDALLRRLFGISDLGPSPGLSSEIIPTAVTQPFTPEMHALKGEILCGGRQSQGAVAGQLAQCSIFNESPNIICVVTDVYLFMPTASEIRFGFDALPAGSVTTGQLRTLHDTRFIPFTPPINFYRTTNVATAFTGGFCRVFMPTNASWNQRITGPWILTPNTQPLIFEAVTANIGMNINGFFRIRSANPAELVL